MPNEDKVKELEEELINTDDPDRRTELVNQIKELLRRDPETYGYKSE